MSDGAGAKPGRPAFAHPAPTLLASAASEFATPRPPARPSTNHPAGLAWSPCGAALAAGAADGWVRFYRPPPLDATTPAAAEPCPAGRLRPGDALVDLAWHPRGRDHHLLLAVCARGHPVSLHAPRLDDGGGGGADASPAASPSPSSPSSPSSTDTDDGGRAGGAPTPRRVRRRTRRHASPPPPPAALFVPRDLRSGDPIPAFSAAFSSDGRSLYVGTACRDAGVRVFDPARPGDAVAAWPTRRRGSAAVAGAVPGTGGGREPPAGCAAAAFGLAPPPASGPPGPVSVLATSACDASLVAAGGGGGSVGLWDGRTGEQLALLHGHGRRRLSGLAFSHDGASLFSAARSDPALHCWDVRALGKGVVWTVARDVAGISRRLGIGLTAGGRTLLAGGKSGGVRAWDAKTGDALGEWSASETGAVAGVAPHPSLALVATAAGGGGGRVSSDDDGTPTHPRSSTVLAFWRPSHA